ncbi:MAG: hypothetical protein IT393_07255 [Nitrospirae bacterium]|nr:hypothetical protein [Nitrospirota bacterium]
MDYRGIVTRGYHVDAGGQSAIRIVSQGYIGALAAVQEIFNIVERTVYFQIIRAKDLLFGKMQSEDARFTITRSREVQF